MPVTAIDHAMASSNGSPTSRVVCPSPISASTSASIKARSPGSSFRCKAQVTSFRTRVTEALFAVAEDSLDRPSLHGSSRFSRIDSAGANELSAATGELAQLSACDRGRLYVIAKAEGENRIRIESLLGREIALHASATGKAWLSGMPRDDAVPHSQQFAAGQADAQYGDRSCRARARTRSRLASAAMRSNAKS